MDSVGGGGAGDAAAEARERRVQAALNIGLFESDTFDVDAYVKKVAADAVYASSITDVKDRLQRVAAQTGEEIKNSVFKNYANIMETSREVGHLEGKMSQLRQSLEEQRKLLSAFKGLTQQTNTVLVATASNGTANFSEPVSL